METSTRGRHWWRDISNGQESLEWIPSELEGMGLVIRAKGSPRVLEEVPRVPLPGKGWLSPPGEAGSGTRLSRHREQNSSWCLIHLGTGSHNPEPRPNSGSFTARTLPACVLGSPRNTVSGPFQAQHRMDRPWLVHEEYLLCKASLRECQRFHLLGAGDCRT